MRLARSPHVDTVLLKGALMLRVWGVPEFGGSGENRGDAEAGDDRRELERELHAGAGAINGCDHRASSAGEVFRYLKDNALHRGDAEDAEVTGREDFQLVIRGGLHFVT